MSYQRLITGKCSKDMDIMAVGGYKIFNHPFFNRAMDDYWFMDCSNPECHILHNVGVFKDKGVRLAVMRIGKLMLRFQALMKK